MTNLNSQYNDFKLTFEIAIIEHLGLNLYSEAHSAISELLANAYDAEATVVEIEIPVGIQLGLAGQQIIIRDNGHGMTYAESRDKFLRIGRNRRKQSRKSKNGMRTVIGKKGIGKLAGFGIANQVRVSTIADFKKTEFLLNLKDIRSAQPKGFGASSDSKLELERQPNDADLTENYQPAEGEPDPEGTPDDADLVREYLPTLITVEQPVSEKQGTIVTLEEIRPFDAIDLEDFVRRLSRKFAIFGDNFAVTIIEADSRDKRIITKFDVPTQFRFPDTGLSVEKIRTVSMGTKEVRYWVGFTYSTIKEDATRGISVIANGKSVQEPFEFKLSGGTEGQFGLQYMTGEVHADWLDEHAVDVIASDRASVRWSDPDATKLLDWGKAKVKELLKEWVRLRSQQTVLEITDSDSDIKREIESYQGEARQELERVVERVVSVISYVGTERTREVVLSIVQAYRHDHIRTVLNKIIDGNGGMDLFAEALRQWDLIDAVLTFQELSVKLSAIRTLHVLIMGRATEVKSKSGALSLHEHLAAHPWLIDPMFSEMQHERNIDNFILEKYGIPVRSSSDDKRFDFILLYDSERIRIVEIKSAKDGIDTRGMVNLMDYHHRITQSEGIRGRSRTVRTLLIYNGQATSEARGMLASLNEEYEAYTWNELLDRNTTIYREQLRHVREKNPNDPRIVTLWDTMQERLSTTLNLPEEALAS
jgi:hypothetical protein